MIKIPTYSKENLDVLLKKRVLVYGDSKYILRLLQIFKMFDINVEAICLRRGDSNNIISLYQDIDIIDENDFLALIKNKKNIIVQFASVNDESDFGSNIDVSPLLAEVIIYSFSALYFINKLRNSSVLMSEENYINDYYQQAIQKLVCEQQKRVAKNKVIICNPPKTADQTLNLTFDNINRQRGNSFVYFIKRCIFYILRKTRICKLSKSLDNIVNGRKLDYINLVHKPALFDLAGYSSTQKIKIITAVREPISQNLSHLYQGIVSTLDIDCRILNEVNNADVKDMCKVLDKLEDIFVKNCGNAQVVFDDFMEYTVASETDRLDEIVQYRTIQNFFPAFNKYAIDIYATPFDKGKGYSIIRKGNIEVFVYQLEKLNSVVPQLSDWIGVPFDKLENGNVAADKWIGESYKQAQKEIEISQEYFDRCYNEEYVKHFYSEEDIEKFKARWRPHIKK